MRLVFLLALFAGLLSCQGSESLAQWTGLYMFVHVRSVRSPLVVKVSLLVENQCSCYYEKKFESGSILGE